MAVFDWVYKLSRWCLGAVFIYAGTLKLLEPTTFAVLLEAYGIVPEGLLMPLAIMLPALEVIAAIGLFFDIRGSLAVISGLLMLFIVVLGYDKDRPIVVYCGFVKCTRSHNGAAWAVKLGYKNVYRYPGGIFAWKGAKYPTGKVE